MRVAAALGALAVLFGAFGAHALRGRVTPEILNAFETGTRYHFYHTLALLVVAIAGGNLWNSKWCARACYAWCIGIVLFSGSLYAMALTDIRTFGAITPLGGLALITGWILLIIAVPRKNP